MKKPLLPTIKNSLSYYLISLAMVFFLAIGISQVLAVFFEPTAAPPGNNTQEPINISRIGQSKAGGLILNSAGAPNGLIIDKGNVGIGTTGPTSKLHIDNTTTAAAALSINRTNTTGSYTTIRMLTAGVAKWYLGMDSDTNPSNDNFAISRSTSPDFVIQQSSGNVGIGTTGPGSKLHLVDNTAGSMAVFEQTNTSGYGVIIRAGGTAAGRYGLVIRNAADNVDYFQVLSETGKEGQTYIKGNVGIGTTGPSSALHVKKAGSTTFSSGDQLRIDGGASGNRAELHLTDGVTSDAFISFKPSATAASRYLSIGAGSNNDNELVIRGDGNVGIGTTGPNEKLHVSGGHIRLTAGGSNTGNIDFVDSTNANVNARIQYDQVAADAGQLNFYTKATGVALAQRMVITNAGNVGIGTAVPGTKLDVAGVSRSRSGVEVNAGDVTFDNNFGIYWHGSGNRDYAIYRESGGWSHPYPDLRIGFHTGIKLGAYSGYGGTRFYNNSDMVTQIFSVGDGDNNVRVVNDLHVGSLGGWVSNILCRSNGTNCPPGTSSLPWSSITAKPAGFADDVDNVGITSESDPTVLASVKDGVSWGEVSSKPTLCESNGTNCPPGTSSLPWSSITAKPAGFADDVDNVGITSEPDTFDTVTSRGNFSNRLIRVQSSGAASMASAGPGNSQLEIISSGRNTPHIAFHAPGFYGANFGLDTDNWFSTQGWTAGGGYTGLRVGSFRAVGGATIDGNLTVAGQNVCRQDGTNCPGDTLQSVTNRGNSTSQPITASAINSSGATHLYGYGTDSWFPYINGWNYLRGPTSLANILYDEQDNYYKLDLNGNSQISSVYANNWFRAQGDTGLYFENWGGGWYMSDPTWIRAYNGKSVYVPAEMRADTVRANWLCIGGTCRTDWNATTDRLTSGSGGYILVMQGDRNIVGYSGYGGGPFFWASNTGISDRRLKRDITTLEGSLDKILKLRGVNFSWNEKWRGEGLQIGLIAQEVKKVFPEVVSTIGDPEGTYGVSHERLIPPIIEAIKEQQKQIEKQAKLIEELQKEVELLKGK